MKKIIEAGDVGQFKARSFAGGDYLCTCNRCKLRFFGPKRAFVCRLCAEKRKEQLSV